MDATITNQWIKKRLLAAASISALLISLCTLSMAHASEFGVRVVDDAGNPVAGASVCFGLPGNYKQFGAIFTDQEGQAVADVPNVPIVVTISKTRFSGTRLSEPARNFNLVKKVTLMDGVPGPRCRAGSSLADSNQSSVRITNVKIESTPGRSTVLTPETTGQPSEYRVSASQYFDNVSWKTLNSNIALPGRFASNEQVYLQLRRFEGTRNGWVEARSDIVTVYLPR